MLNVQVDKLQRLNYKKFVVITAADSKAQKKRVIDSSQCKDTETTVCQDLIFRGFLQYYPVGDILRRNLVVELFD